MISIIVPIYKVEDYLTACIDSILASTYRDFELILVDDGSPDNCGKICDVYAAKDSRIKVIHKQNGGISDARNEGLKVAKGEYFAFVDGDDVIHPRMLEVLHDAINSDDYDFSMILGVVVQDKGIGYDYISESDPVDVQSSRVISRDEYLNLLSSPGVIGVQYHVVWNKLYKRSLVNGHLFRTVVSEDLEWLSRVILGARQAIVVDAGLYYYIQRDGSIMHANDRRKRLLMDTCYMCFNNIPIECPEYRAMMLKMVYSAIFTCRHEFKNTDLQEEINAKATKLYQETKHELIHSKLSWSRKLRTLCFYHFPSLLEAVVKLRYGLLKRA